MNVEDLYRLLRTSHVQAQGIVDTVGNPMLLLDETLRVQMASRSFFETFDVDRYETIGQYIYQLGNGQWDIPSFRTLLNDVVPKSTAVIDYEITHDFPRVGRRTMLLTARTLFHGDRTSRLLLLVMVDITDRARRDAANDVLFAELRHRMKNLIAVLQALARNSPTRGLSAEEFRDALLGRFEALADAQDLAFAEHDGRDEPDLAALVTRILSPYAVYPGTFMIEPSDDHVVLGPRSMTSLALVLHELATNAAKYGALSVADGRVEVRWTVEHGRICLNWEESEGPAVTPPTTTGYGTKVIGLVTRSLGGQVEHAYEGAGLRTKIVIPLSEALLG